MYLQRKIFYTNIVGKKHEIDLTDWSTIFNSIKKAGFNVIIENENPQDESSLVPGIRFCYPED